MDHFASVSLYIGNLIIGSDSVTSVSFNQFSEGPVLTVEGCASLAGTLNISLSPNAPSSGSLQVIEFDCLEHVFESVEFVLDYSVHHHQLSLNSIS